MTRAVRFFSAAAAAVLLVGALAFAACAAPVKIDGIAGNLEWQGAAGLELAGSKTESNCGVEYAYVKWMTDEKNGAVTLAVFVTADGYESGNALVAALFVPQPGSQVAVTSAGVQSCDDSLYSAQSAFAGMSGESFAWEVRIAFKFGLPAAGAMGIRLRDAHGSLSNYYEIPVFTQAGTTTAEETTTRITQTTKAGTSEPATQKERASTARPAGAATTAPQKPASTTLTAGTQSVTSAGAAASQTETTRDNGTASAAGTSASRRFGFTVAAAAVLIAAAAGISVWAGWSGRKKPGEEPGPDTNNGSAQNPPDDGPEEP